MSDLLFTKLGAFVLWYAVVLLVAAVLLGVWAFWQYVVTKGRIIQFATFLAQFGKKKPSSGRGLPLPLLDDIRAKLKTAVAEKPRKWRYTQRWWIRLDDSLVPYAGTRAEKLWYLGRPVERVLDADVLVEPTFNQRFVRALPGLITSAGLLGTFIAILLALWDLRVENNQIIGIAELIQNLAGKFATSIVAIAASIIVSGIEHFWFRGLRMAQRRLTDEVDHLFPQLDEVMILRDVEEDSRRRTVSLSNISSEVVDRFQSMFTAEVIPAFAQNVRGELGPALQELRESMDSVREALKGIQQEKQESVVGEFRNLATGLETTLRTTLEQIGRDFRSSLSGTTTSEFDKAAEALNVSAEVLKGLNQSFSQMRDSLDAVVEEARRATAEQLATGAERADNLNQLVEQLLVRLNESATNSVQQVQVLTMQAIEGLNRQVGELSQQMSNAVAEATAKATDASQDFVRMAGNSARQSRAESEEIVARLERTLERIETVGDSLGTAHAAVRTAITESGVALKAFADAGSQIRASAQALAGTAGTAKEAQESLRVTIGRVSEAVTQIQLVAERQRDTLDRQMQSLSEVERVFNGLDEHLGAVLGEITERLQQHNQAIQQNFEIILKRVNTEIPRVSNALSQATDELSSNVEDLSDVLERMRRSTQSNGQ